MVIAAALPHDRVRTPPARGSRAPLAFSLALHGAAVVLLLGLGVAKGTAGEEPALLVEVSLAAPAPSTGEAQAQQEFAGFLPSPPDVASEPPTELAAQPITDVVPLPDPDTPPEIELSELKPIEPPPPPKPQPPTPPPQSPPRPQAQPPKPAPAAQPPAAPAKAPPAKITQTQSPPDKGTEQTTQQAAAAHDASLFRGFSMSDGRPRFRLPPRPADYPPRALELGQQGEALVRVRLDPDGKAAEILLWRGSGFDMLDRAALAAVRGWHFMPALRNGQPVAAWVEIPVRFVHHTR